MHPQNRPIAEAILRIADLLELQSADPVRVRAYRRASGVLATLGQSVHAMRYRGEDLRAVPGIGEGLAGTVAELADRGSCALLERLDQELPHELATLMALPHMGPQRARAVHAELGIATVEQLHEAASQGRLRALAGFGPRLEHQILKATSEAMRQERRHRLDVAGAAFAQLAAALREQADVRRVEPAGSLRRARDSVGRIVLLAESGREREVVDAIATHPVVREVPLAGRARVDLVTRDGVLATVWVAAPAHFGAAWLQATGSRAHVHALERLAARQRLVLDDHGLARGTQVLAAEDEAGIYEALGLSYIPPELREDRGEIDAAACGRLPALVELRHLAGDLKVQTRDEHGEDQPLRPLVEAARAKGLRYLAVADHVRRLDPSRPNDLARLERLNAEIDAVNAAGGGVRVLKGARVDIRENGTLGAPDAVLSRLDLVIGVLAPPYDLTRRRQTERLLRAMDNPFFSILSEPTARRVEQRAPCALDLPRVLRKARERGCAVELDSRPSRLDLDDQGCRIARDEGVPVAIVSGASEPGGLENLRLGVGLARRGWLSPDHVLNTWPTEALEAFLARTMRR